MRLAGMTLDPSPHSRVIDGSVRGSRRGKAPFNDALFCDSCSARRGTSKARRLEPYTSLTQAHQHQKGSAAKEEWHLTIPSRSITWGTEVVQWLDYSSPTEVNRTRFPMGTASGFTHVGIESDHAADRRGYPDYSAPCNSTLLHTHFASPSPALNTSMLIAAKISPLTHSVELRWRAGSTVLLRVPSDERQPAPAEREGKVVYSTRAISSCITSRASSRALDKKYRIPLAMRTPPPPPFPGTIMFLRLSVSQARPLLHPNASITSSIRPARSGTRITTRTRHSAIFLIVAAPGHSNGILSRDKVCPQLLWLAFCIQQIGTGSVLTSELIPHTRIFTRSYHLSQALSLRFSEAKYVINDSIKVSGDTSCYGGSSITPHLDSPLLNSGSGRSGPRCWEAQMEVGASHLPWTTTSRQSELVVDGQQWPCWYSLAAPMGTLRDVVMDLILAQAAQLLFAAMHVSSHDRLPL
ncbi:hypothetical protein PR048_017099 [Dryococelus australis]|uniref:Uncharacterized protein n=1 Tax=Dryococelus australis TaxID=614101 RepID=A0ABQ9H8L0_9NEOP|nr:hypothetical protein PR048_017099 [Dryococelus australis]